MGLSSFFASARPAFGAAAACIAFAAGAALLIFPPASALLGRGAWPPLHARCIAVMALSIAAALWLARRAQDPAAMRIPLLALAVWALTSVLAGMRIAAGSCARRASHSAAAPGHRCMRAASR
jgi:hypothetical protein